MPHKLHVSMRSGFSQVEKLVTLLGLCLALAGADVADLNVADEQTHDEIVAGGHAQVSKLVRKDPRLWHSQQPVGTLTVDKDAPLEESMDDALCNSSMIGIWRFHEHAIRDHEFQVIRKVDGNMYYQEVMPGIPDGFRTGWLQFQRSHPHKPKRCRFTTTLTDDANLRLTMHKAEGSNTFTLEVAQVGQNEIPLLARHVPPPSVIYSKDILAWLIAVLLLASGPLAAIVCRERSTSGDTAQNATVQPHQQCHDEVKQSHEDWMDALRFTCIIFMVTRHGVQSLERLQQIAIVNLSGILHGLPLFVYVAGKGFGLAVSAKPHPVCDGDQAVRLKAQLVDHLAFAKRRAVQLLLPAAAGAVLFVIPTEYVGRKWRTCAKGPDAPLEWLKDYLLCKNGGVGCEGLGWLGFLLSLFVMQAVLRPWALALQRQVHSSSPTPREDLLVTMAWIAAGIAISSFVLHGLGPLGIGGFMRADTALTFLPPLADLLCLNFRWSWWKSKGEQAAASPANIAALRLPSLARRIVASIAMAGLTKKTPYDKLLYGDISNAGNLWIELCLLTMFYQQGVMDGILRDAPGARDHLSSKFLQPLAAADAAYTQAMASWPRLRDFLRWFFAASLWWWASWTTVASGVHLLNSPGSRYPAHYWSAAGQFVLRSWVVLGLAVWWWGHHLPMWMAKLKMLAPFGFTLYMLHWFFIELVMGLTYNHPHDPTKGDVPWFVTLAISLALAVLAAALCHIALKAATGHGIRWKWASNELVINIKTGTDADN